MRVLFSLPLQSAHQTSLVCYESSVGMRRGYFRHPFSLERKKGNCIFLKYCNQQVALMCEYATRPEGCMVFKNLFRDLFCRICMALISKANKVLTSVSLKPFVLLTILCYQEHKENHFAEHWSPEALHQRNAARHPVLQQPHLLPDHRG